MLALPGRMKLHSTALTHVGRRQNNEDSLFTDCPLGLFAVADGMGGYEGGEIASQLAIQTLVEFVTRNARDDDVTWPYALDLQATLAENMATVAARIAHEQIAHRRTGRLKQMGSTLAMMLVDEHQAVLAHIGDSRIYRLRDGILAQMTEDHSLYEELRRAGGELPSRDRFQYSNVITRALGVSGSADVQTVDLEVGDVYLLCTDGLTEAIDEDTIADTLAHTPRAEVCGQLIDMAYDAGSRDNITAVVVYCDA